MMIFFVLQLKEILKKDDLIIAISGSGNSKNIIKAVEYAKEIGGLVHFLLGFGSGPEQDIAVRGPYGFYLARFAAAPCCP